MTIQKMLRLDCVEVEDDYLEVREALVEKKVFIKIEQDGHYSAAALSKAEITALRVFLQETESKLDVTGYYRYK